jgi:hypothetical protein
MLLVIFPNGNNSSILLFGQVGIFSSAAYAILFWLV